MEYSVGDRLSISGKNYKVIGKIKYKNRNDDLIWFEYRLRAEKGVEVVWLSYDEYYREYSLSKVVKKPDISAYHVVDRGVEEVIGAWGNVDVENGDRASFIEYEDSSEDNIISYEQWEDEVEYSAGYYIEDENIKVLKHNTNTNKGNKKNSFLKGCGIQILIIFLFVFIGVAPTIISQIKEAIGAKTAISDHLKSNSYYTYETSITGKNNEKADVYKTSLIMDSAAKNIINAVKGKTQDVRQNNDVNDNSIAILTKYEYCLIYVSEDNEILVQISNRKYTYHTITSPYHSSTSTHSYYRNYYHKYAYTEDSKKFKDSSPYSSYSSDNTSNINTTSSTYNNYAYSIRQASVNSRSSSGGGTSSGK